jgi:hypothetical protein
MRIIAFESCRVTALFPFEEIIPLGGASDLEITEKIRSKYEFVKGPSLTTDDVSKNGYRFETGKFVHESKPARIADFSVFRDGIVINAVRTEVAEAFLDDVTAYMKREFSFREFMTAPRRYFQSQIVVEFDVPIAKIIESFEKIAAAISKPLAEIYGTKIPMQFGRFDFSADKTLLSLPSPATVHPFIVERRVGIPFEKERYFCSAPLRTGDHIKVLEEIERVLSSSEAA